MLEVNGVGVMEKDREQKFAVGESRKVFRYCPQALGTLGIRTSVVIATILSIPDAFALIPGAFSATEWMLKLIGCWVTALVLWFVFFVGLLHVVRIASGGVELNSTGFKLWRFGRLVPWSAVRSVGIEDQEMFSKIFSFERVVRKLTICTAIAGPFKAIVVPHQIPSFLFSEKDFTELCHLSAERGVNVTPSELGEGEVPQVVLIARPEKSAVDGETSQVQSSTVNGGIAVTGAQPRKQRIKRKSDEIVASVRKTYHLMNGQRIIVTILIALGIGMYLGRRTIVLYSYNEGLKCYRHRNFRSAMENFKTATTFDQTFAPAWHGLAGSEFSLGDFRQARQDWATALLWKPDYVEAKVSLAYLSLQQRDFARAETLINSSLNLAPLNVPALLNRADLNLRTGHIKEALQDARVVLTLNQGAWNGESFMATCLLAHARLLQGRPQEALRIISVLPVSPAKLSGDENLTYRLLVGSRIALALGRTAEAERLAKSALQRAPTLDALLVMADVRISEKEFEEARKILKQLIVSVPHDPWVYIKACQVNMSTGRLDVARENLRSALECRPVDALSLSNIAELYTALGDTEGAVSIAKLSLRMEPVNPAAMAIIERAVSQAGMTTRRGSQAAPKRQL
ncbi:MAG: tetratricopeptide repeat protein [Cyanobacteria bacterium]|nr:tetratricopeptide repeat protein [Cyanobacteriota bacterium]